MKNVVNINLGGGGALYLNENLDEPIFPDGAGWFEIGYLAEDGISITQNAESEILRNEVGSAIKTAASITGVTIKGMLLQSGKDEIDFLNQTAPGKYYQVYYEVHGTNDMVQVWHLEKCKINKKDGIQFGNNIRKIEILINVVKR